MSWRVEFTSGALRQLKKLDPFVRRTLIAWVEKNLEGWRDNMGLFVFSVKDEYDFDREIFFDNFRVEYGD